MPSQKVTNALPARYASPRLIADDSSPADVALSDLFPMRHMLKGNKLLSASTQVVQINRIDDLYFHYFIQIHASDSSARRGVSDEIR